MATQTIVTISPPQTTGSSTGANGGTVTRTAGAYFLEPSGFNPFTGVLTLSYQEDNGVQGRYSLQLSAASINSIEADLKASIQTLFPSATITVTTQ